MTVLSPMNGRIIPNVNPARTGGGSEGQVLRHYTDDTGLAGIQESGLIQANANNQVYVTNKALNSRDAFYDLFIGAPTHAGRGDNVIEFTVKGGAELVPGTQPGELIHYGSLRFGRHIEVHYSGPNPY